jgi:hypothetical protein
MKEENNKNSLTDEGAQNANASDKDIFDSIISHGSCLLCIPLIAIILYMIGQCAFDSIKSNINVRPRKQVNQISIFKESSLDEIKSKLRNQGYDEDEVNSLAFALSLRAIRGHKTQVVTYGFRDMEDFKRSLELRVFEPDAYDAYIDEARSKDELVVIPAKTDIILLDVDSMEAAIVALKGGDTKYWIDIDAIVER